MEYNYTTDKAYELTQEEAQTLEQKYQVYERIIGRYPVSLGKEASKRDRDTLNLSSSTLTYGELDFTSIGEIFYTIENRYGKIKPGGVFYDLGAGTGKGVIAGALLHNFEKCVGIEVLESLYSISLQIQSEYNSVFSEEDNRELLTNAPEVKFLVGDMFEIGWGDADFIFANSTCFDMEMMARIAECPVKPGTWALTLTKSLNSPKWRILESIRKNMSWGEATVYIQQRIEDP